MKVNEAKKNKFSVPAWQEMAGSDGNEPLSTRKNCFRLFSKRMSEITGQKNNTPRPPILSGAGNFHFSDIAFFLQMFELRPWFGSYFWRGLSLAERRRNRHTAGKVAGSGPPRRPMIMIRQDRRRAGPVARVAQLDRVAASEAVGCGFNSRRAHHILL